MTVSEHMFTQKEKIMHFINFTKNDSYYEFETEFGGKYIAPVNAVIIIEEDGMKLVKTIASRKTIGYINN